MTDRQLRSVCTTMLAMIAMDEDVARQQAHDLVGRHAAVGAADPQIGGRLLARQLGEKFGILAADALGPFPVVLEEIVEGAHAGEI